MITKDGIKPEDIFTEESILSAMTNIRPGKCHNAPDAECLKRLANS